METGDFNGVKRCIRYSKRRRIRPGKTRIVSKKKRKPLNIYTKELDEPELKVEEQVETEPSDTICSNNKTYTNCINI